MQRAFSLFLPVAFVLAGCLGGDESGGSGPDDAAPPPAYALDCSISPAEVLAWWPEPCLSLASYNPSTSKSEVDLAVNPIDPLNVVVASKDKDPKASTDCVWSVAQVTKDGGHSWTTVYVGGDKENRVPLAEGYECVTDPIMAFDREGTFYYAMQIYDHTPRGNVGVDCPVPPPEPVGCRTVYDTGSAFILARSKDGGLTYDHYALQAEGAGDLLFHDYPRMLVNPVTQSVHTIWNAFIGEGNTSVGGEDASAVRPVVSSSRDGGQTVDPPLYLQPSDARGNLAFFSGFAAAENGDLYITLRKNEDRNLGEPTVAWIWKSTDDARSFQEVGAAFTIQPTLRQHGDHRFRTPAFVEMAIDTSDGNYSDRIYTFWTDHRYDVSDALSAYSDDGGVTWSDPVHVAGNTERGQYFMRPRVDGEGRVLVLYATQAYSGGELLDQELAWSDDGGTTWQQRRLTERSYDGDLSIHQDDFPFIGDYNGLGVDADNGVHAAFGYTGTGVAEVAYARLERVA